MHAIAPMSVPAAAALLLLSAGVASPRGQAHSEPCRSLLGQAVTCADSNSPRVTAQRPLLAGDAPAFLFAAVQPIAAPEAWRPIYREVERCAAMVGDYEEIRWAVMEAPLQGPKGPTYGFNIGTRIVLVRQDTTYLRHEMLHHILQVAGWQPRPLRPGEQYTVADLHPIDLFGRCTGGS